MKPRIRRRASEEVIKGHRDVERVNLTFAQIATRFDMAGRQLDEAVKEMAEAFSGDEPTQGGADD